MKIKIQGLGAIKTATIDLKPLTVLIGPNNSGKTWLAYILVAIFELHGCDIYAKAYARGELPHSYPLLDAAIDKILSKSNATIDIYKFAQEEGEKYFQNVADYASTWLDSYMNSEFRNFSNLKLSIDLSDTKAAFLDAVEKSSHLSVSGGLFTIRKKRGDKTLYAYISTSSEEEEQSDNNIPLEEIKERLTVTVFRLLHRSLYSNIAVLPTERTTFVTFPFGRQTSQRLTLDLKSVGNVEAFQELIQELQKLVGQDFGSRVEEPLKVVTGPVGRFMSMMDASFKFGPTQIERRSKRAKEDKRIQEYINLSNVLEKSLSRALCK